MGRSLHREAFKKGGEDWEWWWCGKYSMSFLLLYRFVNYMLCSYKFDRWI